MQPSRVLLCRWVQCDNAALEPFQCRVRPGDRGSGESRCGIRGLFLGFRDCFSHSGGEARASNIPHLIALQCCYRSFQTWSNFGSLTQVATSLETTKSSSIPWTKFLHWPGSPGKRFLHILVQFQAVEPGWKLRCSLRRSVFFSVLSEKVKEPLRDGFSQCLRLQEKPLVVKQKWQLPINGK